MNKKLSKSEYLMTLLFLFVIIGALGAFFYGVKVGKDKTTEKFNLMLMEKQETAKESTAYHQQYLVSFYHTVYSPYRDFQKKWFDRLEAIELQSESVDPKDIFKELGKLANEKFKVIEPMAMPATSPLLQEAHSNYLKSLKLFAKASEGFRNTAGNVDGTDLSDSVQRDAFFQEAKNFALLAQKDYYSSIVKWNESVQPDMKAVDFTQKDDLSLNEWGQLNLNLKNSFVTIILERNQHYTVFYPQDLTIRLDEIIANGQAKKMNFTSITPMIGMLVDTKAVRSGDYLKRRQQFYRNETLPQLPFFNE